MNLILLGYPGSGKGTQSKSLSSKLGLIHLSTGDIFRDEIGKKTSLGMQVADYLAGGRLVPDKLVLEVIKSRLEKEDKGVLFDGFPRTVEQAEGLDGYFESKNKKLDAVIFIQLDENEVVGRLNSRRSCLKCGRIYNLVTNPPKTENTCDGCGDKLVMRGDDKPEVVRKRLMVFRDLTEPLIAYYKTNGMFFEINGNSSPEAITEAIITLLKNKIIKA
ncbi:MAG: adenylate kinase [Elusimicrobia bacterium]|nr:adenylate kinase [Elusimicrobiota bacterium]